MSYLIFLGVFIVPPIIGLLVRPPRRPADLSPRRWYGTLPLVAGIALLYTMLWDNYLVYRGVWSYGEERVLAVIGYVPLEEYLFFILQPILTGLFLYHLLSRRPPATPKPNAFRVGVGWLYLVLVLLGIGLLVSGWSRGLYLGLILAWACPVLLGMWMYAGRYLVRHLHTLGWAVAGPTLYLWITDRIAIALGIWTISDQFSLNIDPLGLPVEEAVFFFLTNVLVVQGALLFLFGERIARARPSLV